jgi:CDP-diacylglycerol--glycerol-3-phosphate 3-phosphatidyltransferase
MDPLADKILVSSILICFSSLGLVPCLAVILIVGREFIVTSVRLLILENERKVISANIWGKLKTVSQMITITVILLCQTYSEEVGSFAPDAGILTQFQNILVWISVLLSILSGAIYISDNRRYLAAD